MQENFAKFMEFYEQSNATDMYDVKLKKTTNNRHGKLTFMLRYGVQQITQILKIKLTKILKADY